MSNKFSHGCFFEDLHGNWWNVTCASVHITHHFERRMNLFPAGFDEDGLLYVNTTLGDYPISLPEGIRDHRALKPAAMLLSKDCPVTASSVETAMPDHPRYGNHLGDTQVPFTRYDHAPRFVADEDIRTLWAADSREPGHWAMMDLRRVCSITSLQLNIPTYNLTTTAPEEKYHEFVVESSVTARPGPPSSTTAVSANSPLTATTRSRPSPATSR